MVGTPAAVVQGWRTGGPAEAADASIRSRAYAAMMTTLSFGIPARRTSSRAALASMVVTELGGDLLLTLDPPVWLALRGDGVGVGAASTAAWRVAAGPALCAWSDCRQMGTEEANRGVGATQAAAAAPPSTSRAVCSLIGCEALTAAAAASSAAERRSRVTGVPCSYLRACVLFLATCGLQPGRQGSALGAETEFKAQAGGKEARPRFLLRPHAPSLTGIRT